MSIPTVVSRSEASPVTSETRPLLQAVPVSPRPRETPPEVATTVLVPAYRLTGEAGGALDDLHHALLLAHERGQEVPCQGAGSQAWTSDDYADQQVAADRCLDCPAMTLCERYRAVARPAAGTWASVTSDPARKPNDPGYVPRRRPSDWSGCLCGCGGQPKTARYLPGHDSQHLSGLLEAVRSAHISPDDALAELDHSERLQAKLTRFLGGR